MPIAFYAINTPSLPRLTTYARIHICHDKFIDVVVDVLVLLFVILFQDLKCVLHKTSSNLASSSALMATYKNKVKI